METNDAFGMAEQFTAFIDLLGFSEASSDTDDFTRARVLALLMNLSSARSEFAFNSTPLENGQRVEIRPTISTFSDHIVISYPIKKIAAALGADDATAAHHILANFSGTLQRIALSALSIGLLVRGGATVGNLYHANGIVFGDALIDAYRLESSVAVYPRVVLSQKICNRETWMRFGQIFLRRGIDGLYYFNYFRNLIFRESPPGKNIRVALQEWFAHINDLIGSNLSKLEKDGTMPAFSKWAWFAHEIYSALEEVPLETRKVFGIDIESIPKAKLYIPSKPEART
jgi:hypothetical protein